MESGFFHDGDANRSHVARHQVTPEEAEQVLEGYPLDIAATSMGPAVQDAFLIAITTIRGAHRRVITASPAPRRMIDLYYFQMGV